MPISLLVPILAAGLLGGAIGYRLARRTRLRTLAVGFFILAAAGVALFLLSLKTPGFEGLLFASSVAVLCVPLLAGLALGGFAGAWRARKSGRGVE